MIRADSRPSPPAAADDDFTETHYRQLLRLAKKNYCFATYDAIDWDSHFVLWRHDLDLSVNRAAVLAQIEADEGVTTTYFINLRSDFYNPLEPCQTALIRRIIDLGHRIGLHFDANAAGATSAPELDVWLEREARWLAEVFHVRPLAFSFHNPTAANLVHEDDTYGGLVNCYSKRFKSTVPYCSDSNGYWRFRRLHDVLSAGTDPRLQVLTHPGWWQRTAMPPRRRIFRCVYKRAQRTLAGYDRLIEGAGRANLSGPIGAIHFLRELAPERFEYFDYLWNTGRLDSLLLEMWRYHLGLLRQLSQRPAEKLPIRVKAWLPDPTDAQSCDTSAWDDRFSEPKCVGLAGVDEEVYALWAKTVGQVVIGDPIDPDTDLEQGCLYLAAIIAGLVKSK